MASLADLMAEDEAFRLEEARREIAAEKAAWDALSPEQQAAAIAAREAKFANVPDDDEPEVCEECLCLIVAGACENCGAEPD